MRKVEHKDKESKSGYPHDKVYEVLNTQDARMKNPTTGEWVDAVLYTDGEKIFIREKKDFFDKFKELED